MMSEEPADDMVEKLAVLGEPTAEFTVSGWRPILHLLAAPAATLIGLALTVAPFLLLLRFQGGLIKVTVLGVFLAVAGVVLAVRAVRNWKARVLVYPEGLIYFRSGKAVAVFFDQIQTLWRKQSEGHWAHVSQGALSYTVESADGAKVDFTDYLPNVEELGRILQRETLPHLLPAALLAFNAGGRRYYGPVGIGREGLINGKKTLPWDQLGEVKFDDNKITITQQGRRRKWLSASLSEVPNAHIMREVIEYARRNEKLWLGPREAAAGE